MKPKRVNKTKEELVKEMVGNAKFQTKMKFTKEKFYPAVMDLGTVEEAKMFLASISSVLMDKFLHMMKEKSFKELSLVDALSTKDEKYEQYKAIIDLFDDMTVFDAKDCIEGMKSEIQVFIDDEMKTRPLSSLKTKWIDEL